MILNLSKKVLSWYLIRRQIHIFKRIRESNFRESFDYPKIYNRYSYHKNENNYSITQNTFEKFVIRRFNIKNIISLSLFPSHHRQISVYTNWRVSRAFFGERINEQIIEIEGMPADYCAPSLIRGRNVSFVLITFNLLWLVLNRRKLHGIAAALFAVETGIPNVWIQTRDGHLLSPLPPLQVIRSKMRFPALRAIDSVDEYAYQLRKFLRER